MDTDLFIYGVMSLLTFYQTCFLIKPLMAAEGAYEPPCLATHKLLSPSLVYLY